MTVSGLPAIMKKIYRHSGISSGRLLLWRIILPTDWKQRQRNPGFVKEKALKSIVSYGFTAEAAVL